MNKLKLTISGIVVIAVVASIVAVMNYNNQKMVEQINTEMDSLPPAAGGTNYYVCDTGDDNNNGLSTSTPFQTFGKAMDTFNKMNGGDSILFCRGGVFTSENKRLFNPKCSVGAVCSIADYGALAKERPQIVATDSSVIKFEDSGNADQDGGYIVRNLILLSSSDTNTGIKLFNDVDDVVLDNLHIQGFAIGVHASGSNSVNPGANGYNDRIILKNSVIVGNKRQGWLGGGNNVLIENNVFENNGFERNILNHNIYLESPSKSLGFSITDVIIRGNTLYKSAIVDGKCSGVSLVVHGVISNLTIENNIIKEDVGAVTPYCWGIGIDPGNGLDEVFTNVIIKNNKLLNVGNIAIECSSCDGAIVEGNTIIDEGSILKAGIKIPGKPEDSFKSKNVKISNNNIILSDFQASGISIGGENVFEVNGNDISLPENTSIDCILRKEANENTDISMNTCNKHVGFVLKNLETGEVLGDSVATVGNIVDLSSPTPRSSSTVTEKSSDTTTTSTTETISDTNVTTLEYYNKLRRQEGLKTETTCRAISASGRCLLR